MVVLHLCSYYLGTELYKNLISELNKYVDNCVYVPILKGEKYKNQKNVLISECFTKMDRLFFFRKHNKIMADIEKKNILNDRKYDLIHSHTLFTNGYVALKLHKKFGLPYIVAVRNTDINIFFKYFVFLRKIGIEVLKNSKTIIFISYAAKKELLEKYIPNSLKEEFSKKSIVLPNGIDPIYLNENRNIIQKRKDFLFVGNLDDNKNILKLINVMIEINKKDEICKLIIIGDGKYRNKIEKISKKYNFIKYLGKIKDKKELIKKYQENKYLVVPSKYETFGLVYAEALSQGCKIIYTQGQGFDGWFDEEKVGFRTNILDLKEKILKAIDEKTKLEEEIVLEVKNKFNWNEITKQYYLLYIEI